MPERARTLLVLSQVYVPDPAAVGQHMADAAAEMAARGWKVTVITSARGYDNPTVRYPPREVQDGVRIIRLPWCSFGKRSIVTRLLGGLSFVIQSIARGLVLGPVDRILVSTAPPLAPIAALVLGRLRRAGIYYWVMDLNPDQMIALGRIDPNAVLVRSFDRLNRAILRRAARVIVLDRFMARRINAKLDVSDKLEIIPAWPPEDYPEPIAHRENPFRALHGLDGKLVLMYSGNHGPSNPFSTILAAAERLQHDARLVLVFIGGGIGKTEVESSGLTNVRSLPYQPLDALRYSLSAADVHLVTMGDGVVGIVHPSKVYGAMAVARPVVLLGPEESHVGELLARGGMGWAVRHGDVSGTVRLLEELLAMPTEELEARGRRGRRLLDSELGKSRLCGRLCDVLGSGT